MQTRFRWLAYVIAPLALVFGVALQRYNVHVHDQSAWAGGGFGMFSTVDAPDARARRAYVLTDRGPALIVEPEVGMPLRLLYTQPRTARMAQAARSLAHQEWVVFEPSAYRELWPAFPPLLQDYFRRSPAWWSFLSDTTIIEEDVSSSLTIQGLYPELLAFRMGRIFTAAIPVPARVEGAQIEVWKPVFDPSTDRLSWKLLAEASAPSLSPSSPPLSPRE